MVVVHEAMGNSHTVQVQVLRDGELFLSKVHHRGPLTVGPHHAATIPTDLLPDSPPLLIPQPLGYGVRLGPSMCGRLQVGRRVLRVRDGLLHDPRPEPLTLQDGDSGHIELGQGVVLHFSIVKRHGRRFHTVPRMDLDLAIGLAVGLALALVTLLLVQPWRSPARPTVAAPAPRLRRATVAVNRLVQHRLRHRMAPHHGSRTTAQQRSVNPPRSKRSRRRLRRALPAGGVLALLQQTRKRHPELFPGAKLPAAAQPDRLLAKLDSAFAAVRAPADLDPTLSDRLERDNLIGGSLAAGDVLGELPTHPLDDGTQRALSLDAPPATRAPTTPGPAPLADREEIRKVVALGRSQVQLCYERELIASETPPTGRLVLRWVVGGTGRVRELAVVQDTIRRPRLLACVKRRVAQWIFPTCPQGCAVVYPFEFLPKN